MSTIRVTQRSFAGGEIGPDMRGRFDDAHYQSGLATCLNFITRPQGPADNRPGFKYVRAVKDSSKKTRLISFTYSTTQTLVIEIGAGYFRFHTQGGTVLNGGNPYEVANTYAEADLMDIHYVQSVDVITLVHPNYAPMELKRLGATNWTFSTVYFTPSSTAPDTLRGKSSYTGNASDRYVVTAVNAAGEESGTSLDAKTQNNPIVSATLANPAVFTTQDPHGYVVGDRIDYFVDFSGGTYDRYECQVLSVPSVNSFTVTASNYDTLVAFNSTGYPAFTSGNTKNRVIRGGLYTSGNLVYLTWNYNGLNPETTTFRVYKMGEGGLYGMIASTSNKYFTDNNLAPDVSRTPPLRNYLEFVGASNYPAAVGYYEQRKVFAGTTNEPNKLILSRSSTEYDISYHLPLIDDDRISIKIASREVSSIRHIVPVQDLIVLTSGAEFKISPVNSDVLTPSTVSAKPQSYIGASNVTPTVVNNTVLFGAARGGHLRELGYRVDVNGYLTGDLSLRAAHLFDGYDIVDLAYAKAPTPIVWAVSSSGKLLGLTYVPEQQVAAWHQHTTDGVFESCAVVAEGNEDVLYCVIRRTVNGVSVRYIERMDTRRITALADAVFVDCAGTYSGASTSTISGLSWLEGKTVAVLADGAVQSQKVVTGGAITLDAPATKVQVGLPITADLETLPVVAQTDGGMVQGRQKSVNKVWVKVKDSSGVMAGFDSSNLVEHKQRTTELYGNAPNLITDEIEIVIPPAWGNEGGVFIRQSKPLPISVVGMTAEVALGN